MLTFLDPLNYQTTLTYDNLRRLQTFTDAQSREWQYVWDPLDRISQITDPSETVSESRTYTHNGWLATFVQYPDTPANVATTTYAYDVYDRPLTTTFPDGKYEENSSYDDNGNVLTFQPRTGSAQQIAFVYDALNRVTRKTLPSGQGDYAYQYNLRDQVTEIGTYRTPSYSMGYDSAGRFTGDGNSSIALDANGNVTKLTFPNGSGANYVTKTYDQLDRLVSVIPSGASPPTASISYDALSRRTLLKFSASEYVAYAYQLNNDVTNILHVLPGGTSDSVNIQYGYDKTNRVTSISVDNSAFFSQPSATSTISYTTDTHHLNQYATVQVGSSPAANYSYDNNGNLTSDGTNSFAYHAENRLITTNSTAIAYDALSRLSSDNSGRAWSWFGDNLVSIGSAPLNLITSDTIDDLIFSVSAGTDANIHSDRLGSPIQSGGYGPFGENGQSGPAGFNGQQYLLPGLYSYRSRFCNPSLGRFMQPDSIGYGGGINLYSYVLNDPQSFKDPYGLESLTCGDGPYGQAPVVSPPTGGTATPLGNSGVIEYEWDLPPAPTLQIIHGPIQIPNQKRQESTVRKTTPTKLTDTDWKNSGEVFARISVKVKSLTGCGGMDISSLLAVYSHRIKRTSMVRTRLTIPTTRLDYMLSDC